MREVFNFINNLILIRRHGEDFILMDKNSPRIYKIPGKIFLKVKDCRKIDRVLIDDYSNLKRWSYLPDPEKQASYEKDSPPKLCLRVTEDCTLGCKYCFNRTNMLNSKKVKYMSRKIGKKAVKLFFSHFKQESVDVIFFGGEPLMNFSLIKYLTGYIKKNIKDRKITFHTLTNGTIINKDILQWFLDNDLPVKLPEVEKYEPTDTGESPLANLHDWVNTACPKCGKLAKRETDTMPNWAGSSWYFLRYIDPKNDKEFADPEKLKYWMPVDWYNGGMEHTTLHLLYSRFWNKFLYDCGFVPFSEPYQKRTSHGMVLGEGGEKMSKSRGNVINPDDVVEQFGADVFRMYEMFIGPFDQSAAWDTLGINGIDRFIRKVWRLVIENEIKDDEVTENQLFTIHNTIKLVTEQVDTLDLNTAISQLMIFVNDLSQNGQYSKQTIEILIKLLAPFAPHISEELWQYLGHTNTIAYQGWPKYEEKYLIKKTIVIPIQINGKVRDKIDVDPELDKEKILSIAKESKNTIKYLKNKEVVKEIYVPGKIINFVVR